MTERKSRFGDPTAMPDDPALRVLALRPQNATGQPRAPRTWPGRLAEEDGVGLQNHLAKERAERAAERDAGLVLVKLDPESIGLTAFANRHELSLSSKDKKLKALKASIKANGQDTPVRVRPVSGGDHPYELVEGHRRHAAIRELNRETEGGFQILARLDAKAAETKDFVLKMYRENAEREDLSAFETGRMFHRGWPPSSTPRKAPWPKTSRSWIRWSPGVWPLPRCRRPFFRPSAIRALSPNAGLIPSPRF